MDQLRRPALASGGHFLDLQSRHKILKMKTKRALPAFLFYNMTFNFSAKASKQQQRLKIEVLDWGESEIRNCHQKIPLCLANPTSP